jgi:hypothetical protein
LTSTSISKPLSAKQGKILKELIDGKVMENAQSIGNIEVSSGINMLLINPVVFSSVTVNDGSVLKLI